MGMRERVGSVGGDVRAGADAGRRIRGRRRALPVDQDMLSR